MCCAILSLYRVHYVSVYTVVIRSTLCFLQSFSQSRNIYHAWYRDEYHLQASKRGYSSIMSSCWYLDHADKDWRYMYNCQPDLGADKKLYNDYSKYNLTNCFPYLF